MFPKIIHIEIIYLESFYEKKCKKIVALRHFFLGFGWFHYCCFCNSVNFCRKIMIYFFIVRIIYIILFFFSGFPKYFLSTAYLQLGCRDAGVGCRELLHHEL